MLPIVKVSEIPLGRTQTYPRVTRPASVGEFYPRSRTFSYHCEHFGLYRKYIYLI